jgi:hypothetical protein
MTVTKRLLFFFILPIFAMLLFPPATLLSGLPVIAVAMLIFIGVGFLLWRGSGLALNLMIFLLGFNVIVRLMMFLPHVRNPSTGAYDITYILTGLISLALSVYLLLRLDRNDVRATLVS